MSSREAVEAACWVCGGLTQRFWANDAFESVACRRCGHVVAPHRRTSDAEATDYHLGYEQRDFVTTLGATRRRQAARLLDELAALDGPPRSIFDFGCGRGFFTRDCANAWWTESRGRDVSELALASARHPRFTGVEASKRTNSRIVVARRRPTADTEPRMRQACANALRCPWIRYQVIQSNDSSRLSF